MSDDIDHLSEQDRGAITVLRKNMLGIRTLYAIRDHKRSVLYLVVGADFDAALAIMTTLDIPEPEGRSYKALQRNVDLPEGLFAVVPFFTDARDGWHARTSASIKNRAEKKRRRKAREAMKRTIDAVAQGPAE